VNGTLVDVLLGLGVAAELLCVAGCAAARTVYDRLHYTAAGTTVGPILILAALLGKEGLTSAGLDSIAAVALLFLVNPIVVHATGRAARSIDFGDVEPAPKDGGE
jgi:monovalent cation/proton antiporter MnhG/PhaG subunit